MLILALILFACGPGQPASIEAKDTVSIYVPSAFQVEAKALDSKGNPLPESPVLAVAVSDPLIIDLGTTGKMRCLGNGSSTVTLQAGTVKKTIVAECLLIREIRLAQDHYRVVLGPKVADRWVPVPMGQLDYQLVGHNQLPMDSSYARIMSSDPSVVGISEGTLEAVAPGTAEIKITAGDQVATATVEVGQDILSQVDLVVADGKSVDIPVKPGKYLFKAGASQAITVGFAGTSCRSTAEALEHELPCDIEQSTTMHIENPGVLGMGGGSAQIKYRLVRFGK